MITGLQLLAHMAAPAILTVAASTAPSAGIQAGPVCMPTTVHPGGTYSFPPVEVADTGSGSETIGVTVHPDPDGTGLPVPPSWIHIGPGVNLNPGTTGSMRVSVTIPADAKRGPYTGWLVAAAGTSPAPGQASFSGEGIADLEFTVNSPARAVRAVACVNPGQKRTDPAAVPAADSAPASSGGISGGKVLVGGAAIVVVVFLIRRRRAA